MSKDDVENLLATICLGIVAIASVVFLSYVVVNDVLKASCDKCGERVWFWRMGTRIPDQFFVYYYCKECCKEVIKE